MASWRLVLHLANHSRHGVGALVLQRHWRWRSIGVFLYISRAGLAESNCPLVGPIRGTRTSRCWRPGAVIKLRPGDCARWSVLSVPVLAVVEVGKRCNKEQCLWYFGISSVTCLHPGVSLHVCVQAWCHVGWQISRGVGIRKQALYCYRGCSLRAITSLGRV